MQDTIRFVFDDRIVEIGFHESSPYRPTTTVLNYLRSLPGHKGVKEGCAEGDCGACTVVLAETGEDGRLVYKTVDSCLVFLPMIHGKQLITVENLSMIREQKRILHPVQEMMVKHHGTQCGYCTPGVVMSLFGLYKNRPDPSGEIIGEALAGNLCRCTGYHSILRAASEACSGSGKDHFSQYEPVVTAMLNEISGDKTTIGINKGKQHYYKPFTLAEALRLRAAFPQATVTCGSTDIALRQTKNKEFLAEILDLSSVAEMQSFREDEHGFDFGAGLTLQQVKELSFTRLPVLSGLLERFGSLQIRNLATLGGNIGSASPIGDTLPFLISSGSVVRVVSVHGERTIPIEDFLAGYRKTNLGAREIIASVRIPKPAEGDRYFIHKVSKRKDLDISTVSCAFRLRLEQDTVREIILAYGGMAATPKRALRAEQYLAGKSWSEHHIKEAALIVMDEFTPISDARAQAEYRREAAGNLLLKFYQDDSPAGVMDPLPVTSEDPAMISDRLEENEKHVTGESLFIEDLPGDGRTLIGHVVYSRQAHAMLKQVDISKAMNVPGVLCILTARDIPGENQMGPVIHDEPCLADKEVNCIGQAIALIAGVSEEAAIEAEKLIEITYEPLPAVLDIRSSMASGDLIAPERTIRRGDAGSALERSPHLLRGEFQTGAQEHWYLETQSAMATPGEGDEMFVHASSQNPTETQAIVAEVLGIPGNRVEVEVRRIGGGFGGKETQGNHVAAWAALLANATKRPVKVHLFRDDDQVMTGKRHRYLSEYEIGFDDDGHILAYRVVLNADAGYATDLSRAILERAMLHADNAYYIPDVSITGKAWKTNLPSNTAFRGFGGPQGMAVIENAIDRMARYLGKDAAEIRRMNFYREGTRDITPYGQTVVNNHLGVICDRLLESSSYLQRRQEINQFNSMNRYYKRGIAMTPVKFGISFTTSFLNQAGALVNIYTDGTVLVNHGGTEMGQGLHAKIHRIACAELGLPPAMVRVNATNTSKVPNTSPTAASSGSDLNGMAVKNAIEKLKARLAPVAVKELRTRYPEILTAAEFISYGDGKVYNKVHPECTLAFADLCSLARVEQVSLSATGYYRTPEIFFDREKGEGRPFFYFAYGMAVSEVRVDVLTGECRLLRTDILHDAGDSISEAIDIGQVEGGFIQGVGWCTTEEIKWDDRGRLLTHSPDTYKIPTIGDIPKDFRVSLLRDVPNPGTIRQSKAVGEPPFMLSLSVWLAIKDAVSAVEDHHAEPDLPIPATAEKVLQAINKIK